MRCAALIHRQSLRELLRHAFSREAGVTLERLAENLSYFYDAARFICHKHVYGYEVNPEPTFEPEALEFFKSVIRETSIYLEYGSGGSTILAARFVKALVSVESDRIFKRAVEKALPPHCIEIHLLSPSIGVTAKWGMPVFQRPTSRRIDRWKRYPKLPWAVLNGRRPETILIDGRLRVACALESLLNVDRNTRILVDDYVGRNYSIIEQFSDLISVHGMMAEFRKRTDFDAPECRKALEHSYSDLS